MDNKSSTSCNKRDRFQIKRERDISRTTRCNLNPGKLYKSPRSLTKSPEAINLIDNFVNNKKMRVTRGMVIRWEKQSKMDSSCNNTIIINDSDNESSSRDNADSSIYIIERKQSTERTLLFPKSQVLTRSKTLLKNSIRPKEKLTLLNNDSTCMNMNMQETSRKRSIEGENIAPSQTEDEVVELWSCLRNISRTKKEVPKQQTNNNFVTNSRSNKKTLDYIRIDTAPVRKRRKISYSPIKFTSQVNSPIWQAGERKKNAKLNLQLNTNSDSKPKLREIIVDGCNVAMAHTNGRKFSQKGIALIINYFEQRGHIVKVFLPQHVRNNHYKLLEQLYKDGTVVFTPSRYIDGKQITPYDDRYILSYATKCGGIVISSDQYRDLYKEKSEWRDTILNRLLAPTFVGDYVMFPEDPLGKFGPDLDTFLRH